MLTYAFYSRLFTKLNIPDTYNNHKRIIDNNYEFYRNYAESQDLQLGGVIHKTETIQIKYGEYTFKLFKQKHSDKITYTMFDEGNEESSNVCMLLAVIPKEKYIHIDTIETHPKCLEPYMPKNHGGSLLLQITLSYCRILKDQYTSLKYVQLRDTSTLICEPGQKFQQDKIKLPDFYMFTKGDTWYGKYGFKPFDALNRKLDKKLLLEYKHNQKVIKTTKIKNTNIKNYIYNASVKFGMTDILSEETVNKIIERHKEKTIQEFFSDFFANRGMTCHIFNEIQHKIMKDLSMTSFYGKSFFIMIDDIVLD